MCQVNNFDGRSICVFILLIGLELPAACVTRNIERPELAFISYVSAEIVTAGAFDGAHERISVQIGVAVRRLRLRMTLCDPKNHIGAIVGA